MVLGLIFLKFASDKFEERRQFMIEKSQEPYLEMPDFYGMANVFYLNEESRWSYIIKNSEQNNVALKIDTAPHNIEKNNQAPKGTLPEKLTEVFIEPFTAENELVMDLFVGNGTVASVHKQKNRKFSGCDISQAAIERTQKG